MGDRFEQHLSECVRAVPLEDECPYNEMNIVVHPEEFDEVFVAVGPKCEEPHRFRQES